MKARLTSIHEALVYSSTRREQLRALALSHSMEARTEERRLDRLLQQYLAELDRLALEQWWVDSWPGTAPPAWDQSSAVAS